MVVTTEYKKKLEFPPDVSTSLSFYSWHFQCYSGFHKEKEKLTFNFSYCVDKVASVIDRFHSFFTVWRDSASNIASSHSYLQYYLRYNLWYWQSEMNLKTSRNRCLSCHRIQMKPLLRQMFFPLAPLITHFINPSRIQSYTFNRLERLRITKISKKVPPKFRSPQPSFLFFTKAEYNGLLCTQSIPVVVMTSFLLITRNDLCFSSHLRTNSVASW